MFNVTVSNGDVTQTSCDALITAINSGGLWWGGIDSAIMRCAGDMYHRQASRQQPLIDGQVVVARGTNDHLGKFRDVIFVVDDLKRPLQEIVLAGLNQAEAEGYTSVALPSLRTGVMKGAFEKTVEDALMQTATGVLLFESSDPSPQHVQLVQVVVYNDPSSVAYLKRILD